MKRTTMPTEENIERSLIALGMQPTEDLVFAYKKGFHDGGATRQELEELVKRQAQLAFDARRLKAKADEAIAQAERIERQGDELRRLAERRT